MVMSAVEEGEIMIIGFNCFFFCCFAAIGATGCAGCRLPRSSFICFSRGATSARTDSKFCQGEIDSSQLCRSEEVARGEGAYVDPLAAEHRFPSVVRTA